MRMHNCWVRRYWSPQHIIGIREVDDNDLVLLIDFFSNANEMVALES